MTVNYEPDPDDAADDDLAAERASTHDDGVSDAQSAAQEEVRRAQQGEQESATSSGVATEELKGASTA